MGKYFLYLTINVLFLQLNIEYAQIASLWNQDSSFYYYSADYENLYAEKINFNSLLTREEILDSIAYVLSSTYFIPKSNYYKEKQKIIIEVDSILIINSQNRDYRIAVIDIIDPDGICQGSYFQGSTGGYATFLILVSNLIQPQLKDPLLEGIVFLYNRTELKNMDHINLEGIISEREIDREVRKALKQ